MFSFCVKMNISANSNNTPLIQNPSFNQITSFRKERFGWGCGAVGVENQKSVG